MTVGQYSASLVGKKLWKKFVCQGEHLSSDSGRRSPGQMLLFVLLLLQEGVRHRHWCPSSRQLCKQVGQGAQHPGHGSTRADNASQGDQGVLRPCSWSKRDHEATRGKRSRHKTFIQDAQIPECGIQDNHTAMKVARNAAALPTTTLSDSLFASR